MARRAKPMKIRMENGPEFIAKITEDRSQTHGMEFHHIQLSKPTQNAYMERFNGSFGRGVMPNCSRIWTK